MAKKNIHPPYKPLTLIRMDGSKFITNSASEVDHLSLDVDFKNHVAWGGASNQVNQKATTVAKFNKRFGLISSLKKNNESNTNS